MTKRIKELEHRMRLMQVANWARECSRVCYNPYIDEWSEHGSLAICYIGRRQCDCRYDGRVDSCTCNESAPYEWHVAYGPHEKSGYTYDAVLAAEMVEDWVAAWKETEPYVELAAVPVAADAEEGRWSGGFVVSNTGVFGSLVGSFRAKSGELMRVIRSHKGDEAIITPVAASACKCLSSTYAAEARAEALAWLKGLA